MPHATKEETLTTIRDFNPVQPERSHLVKTRLETPPQLERSPLPTATRVMIAKTQRSDHTATREKPLVQ